MAQIQNVPVWYKGEQHQANQFMLYSIGDNLLDSATFSYQLIELIITPAWEESIVDENGDIVVIVHPEEQSSQTLLKSELSINGADYILWDTEVDANAWIYQWAAGKLNLTII